MSFVIIGLNDTLCIQGGSKKYACLLL